MKPNCWIVFHWQPDPVKPRVFLPCVVGVYDDIMAAESNCLDRMYYVFPMTMNESIHGEPIEHPGAYYPKGLK